ncbi:MAG: GTPase HflX [Dehalococcoidia bacterium]|nr:MAG: GTPase HflX [Dehalococcoidia bacterium]
MKRIAVTARPPVEKALLVGVEIKGERNGWSLEGSVEELGQLARTAGAAVVGSMTQRLAAPTPAYYIGKGKLEELASLRGKVGYNLVIFDNELTPAQQRNLEQVLDVKVIDRTTLILDIFARRARTHEGRLQVELAQQEYLLPRLARRWPHLERLGAGIGTRGPGETQLETDRRLIQRRIQRLKGEIEAMRKHRALYRRRRSEQGIPVVALVGYTNAGKSTLLNSLSNADVLVESKLFATLDPTTRRLILPDNKLVLFTDTVGFIQKLPPTLVAAFRATLEELAEANLLLLVVDIASETAAQQCHTVEDMLEDLSLTDKPRLIALNKLDLLAGEVRPSDEEAVLKYIDQIGTRVKTAALISAAKGWGLERMLQLVAEKLDNRQ